MKPDPTLDGAKPGDPLKPGKGKPGGKLQKWIQTHKPEAALGVGAVGAVGIALYRRSSGGSGAAATTGGTTPATMASAPDGTTAGGVAYGGDPASDYGNYDAVGVAAALTSSLNGLTTTDANHYHSLKKLLRKDIKTSKAPAAGSKRTGRTPKKGGTLGGKRAKQGPIRKVNQPKKAGKAAPKHKGKK